MTEEEKRGFYQNGMWSFYAIVVGLIVGTYGNFYASVAYDYLINNKHDLGLIFSILTVGLILLILPFLAIFVYCVYKYKPWRLK